MREGEQFLNEKYDLHNQSEIESAVKRQEVRTGEKAKDKTQKVEAYLGRLEEIFDVENPKRERRVDILKDKLHELFVVKPDEIPESYFNHQKRIAREQGHGDIEITDQMRRQMAETIIHDQTQSLDAWVDYLGSSDATYPNWLKYFAFRSITKLSEYDKDKKEFKKRSKGTTAPFPDINREALAYVLDFIEKSHKKEARENTTDEQWEKLLKTANFGKLYGYAIDKITPASEEEKEQVQGEWIKYEQGSDAEPLYKSLQGHGTGWCTAGEGVARTQLEAGDFYVFYSHTPVKGSEEIRNIPRVAIRMENGEIAEVRGINADQNLEPVMTDIAKDKVKELSGAERYEKKVSDMKRLTEIEKKFEKIKIKEKQVKERIEDSGYITNYEYLNERSASELKSELELIKLGYKNVELTKEELIFLYELAGQRIDGFGYKKDPRIEEIKDMRDVKKDCSIIFGCKQDEVAIGIGETSEKTVAFVGSLSVRDLEWAKIPKNLKYVMGGFYCYGSSLNNLGQLEIIGGDADFRPSGLENLGNLQSIWGAVIVDENSKLDFSRIKHSRMLVNNSKEFINYIFEQTR